MNNKTIKKDLIKFVFIFLISITIFSIFSFPYLNDDNCNYAVEEIHHFNNKIFNGNINTIDAKFSPRFYANVFMSFLTHFFNSDWFEASVNLIRLNYILYAIVASIATIKLLNKNQLLSSLLMSIYLMKPSLISIAFGLDGAPDVLLGTAIPLSFLALICVLGKNKYWLTAWVLVTISTFLHVHEGFWAAFILGVIWIAISLSDKKINFKVLIYIIVYLLLLMLIVIPPLSIRNVVDNNYFTQIYVFIRTPHHLLLSYIGKEQIIKSITLLFFINFILFIDFWKYRKNFNERRTIFLSFFLSVTYIILLFIHYFSTEIFRIPLVITMYIPKSFKFLTFLGIITYITLGLKNIEKNKYIKGILLLLIPLIPNLATNNFNFSIATLCLIFILIFQSFKIKITDIRYKTVIRFFIYIVFFLLIYKNFPFLLDRLKFIYLGIFIYEFIIPYIKIKGILYTISFLLILNSFYLSLNGKLFNVNEKKHKYINGLDYARGAVDPYLYDIAIQFKNITTPNDSFLSDPYVAYSNYFQLFSERNCYAIYKNTPSHKYLVIEWYKRVQEASIIKTASAEELKQLLENINIEYVLVNSDRFEIFQNSIFFIEVLKNEQYGIYKLVR